MYVCFVCQALIGHLLCARCSQFWDTTENEADKVPPTCEGLFQFWWGLGSKNWTQVAHDVWVFSVDPSPELLSTLPHHACVPGGWLGHLEGLPPTLALVWLGQWEAGTRIGGSGSEVRVIYSLASSLWGPWGWAASLQLSHCCLPGPCNCPLPWRLLVLAPGCCPSSSRLPQPCGCPFNTLPSVTPVNVTFVFFRDPNS